jgi:hypothetical protein
MKNVGNILSKDRGDPAQVQILHRPSIKPYKSEIIDIKRQECQATTTGKNYSLKYMGVRGPNHRLNL